jgi:DNA mismatch repair ATPase MutS
MLVDNITLYDLSIFHREEEQSLFSKIDHTRTIAGKAELKKNFSRPFSEIKDILQVQQILSFIGERLDAWPKRITNGTLLVIEKFLDDNPDALPEQPNPVNAFLYKLLHPADHAMVRFSMQQLFECIKGFEALHAFFADFQRPSMLDELLQISEKILRDERLKGLQALQAFNALRPADVLHYGRIFHEEMATDLHTLMGIYGKLDAWYAMAKSNQLLGLQLPIFTADAEPMISAKGLWHLMLREPVGYDLEMNPHSNFIFLTGANMAGKTTLIKAVGLSTYLAHLGMGVAAKSMRLSLFEGILSNITVEDNLIKGESYFFNEVRRIRETITRISDGKRWLILIDELFKGTNIQDAMKCSLAVIRGLIRMRNGLFILSTHLYEIGDELKDLPSINFKYFETHLTENELRFSYQLKEGISQDRMGYLILQKEGVTSLLENIGKNTAIAGENNK